MSKFQNGDLIQVVSPIKGINLHNYVVKFVRYEYMHIYKKGLKFIVGRTATISSYENEVNPYSGDGSEWWGSEEMFVKVED